MCGSAVGLKGRRVAKEGGVVSLLFVKTGTSSDEGRCNDDESLKDHEDPASGELSKDRPRRGRRRGRGRGQEDVAGRLGTRARGRPGAYNGAAGPARGRAPERWREGQEKGYRGKRCPGRATSAYSLIPRRSNEFPARARAPSPPDMQRRLRPPRRRRGSEQRDDIDDR